MPITSKGSFGKTAALKATLVRSPSTSIAGDSSVIEEGTATGILSITQGSEPILNSTITIRGTVYGIVDGLVTADSGGDERGGAYVFTRSGSTWTQQAKLVSGTPSTNGYFGKSVKLSANGDTAIVGARYEDTGSDNAGAAYIFAG